MGEKKRRLAAADALAGQVAAARELHSAGKLKAAEEAFQRILRSSPERADAWLGLGLLARDAGVSGERVTQLFARAVSLAPDDAQARVKLAAALHEREDFDGACTHLRAACALRPDDAEWWESLGIAEQAAGNLDAAVDAYRRAAELDPTAARRVKLATAISPIPASRATIAAERQRMREVLDAMLTGKSQFHSNETDPITAGLWTNFYLAYHGENDRDLQMKAATVYRRICPSLNYVAAHCRQPSVPSGKIRIGLASQFFRNHSIGRTSRGLFAQLSREQFEVTAIFVAPFVDDEFSRAIRRDADHTLVVPRDLEQARERIAALRLDILFYQDIGMEPFTYFLSFARLAPVQCVSFGHPDTTGVDTIDYFISNDLYEPPGAAGHYSESLFTLHDLGSLASYTRPVLPAVPKTRAAFRLPVDRPLYLCPQNLFKVHPDMDGLMAGILRKDPRGVVVMVEGRVGNWTRLLRKRWQETMPDLQSRIVFLPRMPEDDYLCLIALADVMLDTVHFNGMNTSLEAFAVGTPVVTMPAAFQRGRHTQAMLRKMGLEVLVVADAQAYIDQAVRIANDRDSRNDVSGMIRERSHVLFEDAAVVREFERFFLWARQP
jgi:predicted O-linked N-acetylglucosamine transferase (SPINDLY family)